MILYQSRAPQNCGVFSFQNNIKTTVSCGAFYNQIWYHNTVDNIPEENAHD